MRKGLDLVIEAADISILMVLMVLMVLMEVTEVLILGAKAPSD